MLTYQLSQWTRGVLSRRMLLLALASSVVGLALPGSAKVVPSSFNRIYAEFQQPAGTKVLVAAHRGLSGRSTGAWEKYPENSLAAIADCIEKGIDIVEVDVRKTRDGHLVMCHDSKVDRTTDGTGAISDMTLAEIRQLRLRLGVGGTNAPVTDHRMPTLDEVMLLAKDKCMVNLDKAWIIVPECCAVLKKTGTIRQAIFKSSYSAARCEVDFAHLDPPVFFMPIILHKKGWEKDKVQGWAQLEPYIRLTKPCAFELVFVSDDDPIVSPEITARIKRHGARVWINTLWDSLAAGHTDARSLTDPAGGWGWAISRGANIIQSDESERLLLYLRSRDLHW
ncbi:MAG TPA: glycerophosphodiester phosphodiesterase family protein [Candidatus Paceibacterota bacterium]|nr:glycerophosphodiester phosphodiesterase family protein [Candidatus Paceibacterota bacterium]